MWCWVDGSCELGRLKRTITATTVSNAPSLDPTHREAAEQARMAQMKQATERARADPAFQELDARNPGTAIFFAGRCVSWVWWV